MHTIGEAMKAGRDAMGLTAREVALLVGKTDAQISKYENGHTDPPRSVLATLVNEGIITAEQALLPFRAAA